jgi:hypothetical protein
VIEQQDGNDPIFSVLNVEPTHSEPFEDLSEPFISIERGPGGHAPYTGTKTAREYFLSRSDVDTETLRSEYRTSISNDTELFERRLETLEDLDLEENTLVIYTSDHGELLGEGGSLGHNAPMRPELVYVPTTFIHPDIPKSTEIRLFRHIDLVPSILKALDETDSLGDLDGTAGGTDSEPGLSFYRSDFDLGPRLSLTLSYDGVWTAEGGYVFTDSRSFERLAVLAGKLIKSPKRDYLRQHMYTSLRSYLASDRRYASPGISKSEAKQLIIRANSISASQSSQGDTLSDEAAKRLEDMGYI